MHEFAEAVTAKQLFASPLLQEPVDEGDLGTSRKSRLPGYPAALSAEFLRFESTNIEDHIGGQSGATMIPRPKLPKMPKAGLAPKGEMEMPKEAELGVPMESSVTAGAGIIAFGGGGATVTRSLAVARSAGLTLSIATESTTGRDNSLSFSVTAVGITIGGSHESSTSKGKTRSGEKAAEEESETVIEFTLGDDMIGIEPPRATSVPGLCYVVLCCVLGESEAQRHACPACSPAAIHVGDYFDVKVMRDPIYGTPIFVTLAGRSMCPHEACSKRKSAWCSLLQPDRCADADARASTAACAQARGSRRHGAGVHARRPVRTHARR